MIAVAYIALVAAFVWWSDGDRRDWLKRSSPRTRALVRGLALAAACGVALGGVALALTGDGASDRVLIGGLLAMGGVSLASGLALWKGASGARLREAGWLTTSAALSVPSTLTLGLLLVAPIVVTLVELPNRGRGGEDGPRER